MISRSSQRAHKIRRKTVAAGQAWEDCAGLTHGKALHCSVLLYSDAVDGLVWTARLIRKLMPPFSCIHALFDGSIELHGTGDVRAAELGI